MKRSPMKPRTRPLRSTTRVKPVNRARRTREWIRAYGSIERVNFVAGRDCCACAYGKHCENHHVRTGGKGRKADARWIAPLCWVCHRELHTIGRTAFEAYYGITLDDCAAATEAAWVLHQHTRNERKQSPRRVAAGVH